MYSFEQISHSPACKRITTWGGGRVLLRVVINICSLSAARIARGKASAAQDAERA